MNEKIKILALSWRDIKAPKAGGAEVHTHMMLSGLGREQYEVVHISPEYEGCTKKEVIDGVTYIRMGNIFTVIWKAFRYYRRHRNEYRWVIDQCNTHRFFTWMYVPQEKRVFYIHQLTREIWKYNMKWPWYKVGQALETWMLKRNRKDKVITVSKSTKQELVELGYNPEKIVIVYNGINFEPWSWDEMYEKEPVPTFIYAGRYVPYKGIDVAIQAFVNIKKEYPDAKLWILGKKNQEYVDTKLLPICKENHISWGDDGDESGDVVSWGYVSEEKKLELLSRATALLFPSVREGWGIPITEAGVVGTPSIVFDSTGIRDAIDNGKAGYLCETNDVEGLVEQIKKAISDDERYAEMRRKAYEFSSQFRTDRVKEYLIDFFDKG